MTRSLPATYLETWTEVPEKKHFQPLSHFKISFGFFELISTGLKELGIWMLYSCSVPRRAFSKDEAATLCAMMSKSKFCLGQDRQKSEVCQQQQDDYCEMVWAAISVHFPLFDFRVSVCFVSSSKSQLAFHRIPWKLWWDDVFWTHTSIIIYYNSIIQYYPVSILHDYVHTWWHVWHGTLWDSGLM